MPVIHESLEASEAQDLRPIHGPLLRSERDKRPVVLHAGNVPEDLKEDVPDQLTVPQSVQLIVEKDLRPRKGSLLIGNDNESDSTARKRGGQDEHLRDSLGRNVSTIGPLLVDFVSHVVHQSQRRRRQHAVARSLPGFVAVGIEHHVALNALVFAITEDVLEILKNVGEVRERLQSRRPEHLEC